QGFLSNLALQSKSASLGSDLTTGLIRISDFLPYTSNTFLIGLTVILSAIVLAFLVFYTPRLTARGRTGTGSIRLRASCCSLQLCFSSLHCIATTLFLWLRFG